MLLEIRTYKVKPGRLDEFVAALRGVRPMLAAAGIDVVDLGPSIEHDEGEHAYLLRAFADAEERQAKEDAFYGSAAWREGPRAAVLDPLEGYQTVLLDLPAHVVDGMRRPATVD
ncbi:hypothetical protein GCM10023148_41880 [Actinokineospora soli]